MNISPVPIPNNLFQPIANHWLPANKGRVIVSECEGVDYLCLDGECRLAYQLPKEKKAEPYDLLFDLLNLVREPAQWNDLTASVSPENLISWCEKYGMVLQMEIMPDGGEGVRFWQLTYLMLNPNDSARRYHLCPCGRQFYGHANRKWCPRCDGTLGLSFGRSTP